MTFSVHNGEIDTRRSMGDGELIEENSFGIASVLSAESALNCLT
jgi:hypothetical protein